MEMLIPLSRFEVNYEVGSGRPYSDLDRLVLQAVADGAGSVERLSEVFKLPKRLLIEVIVTLARAGWVAIDVAEGGFKATAAGAEAAQAGTIPPFCILRNIQSVVVMERLTGSLISERGDISYTNSYELRKSGEWEKSNRLPATYFEDRLDAGQVDRLLRTEPGEWIHSVGTPALISRGRHWLPVRVDIEKQKVHRLPEPWQKELAPILLARAASHSSPPVRIDLGQARIETATPAVETHLAPEDLLANAAAHRDALSTALKDARTTVLIASAFLDRNALEGEFRELIVSALKRGVQVNLLWGYSAGMDIPSTKHTLRWLRDIRRETGSSAGLLRFNGEPTESHAKLLIYDGPEGHTGYVGSYNWLSTPLRPSTDFTGSNVSIRLRHPLLTASLYRMAASLWLTSVGAQTSEAPERLRRIAAAIEEQNKLSPAAQEASPDKCSVRLVRDREHTALLRDFLLYDSESMLLTSHKLGSIAATRLASRQPAGNAPNAPLTVGYGQKDLEADALEALTKSAAAAGVTLRHTPHLHSKILATSKRALVSSFNFLSTDPFGTQSRARELGVFIEGGSIPSVLLNLPIGNHTQ